ncbi:hypothetical protein JWG39_05975 [Desulforhopalus vacuolatus]|uniref:hypothetical protein n=1 Tax=Desulforhopalus vacuolatus TaxID=40414 RepID=UPI0019659C31|nr:hypothetical protein [Desulforhopalus vacuolatus]MBM9519370.1 hypothetical protein [Desulforhopalus vacuolatus]
MIRKIMVICSIVSILSAVLLAGTASADELENIWGKLHGDLSDAVGKLEERSGVPDSSWNPFTSDKVSVDSDIDDILDDVVELLGAADISQIKKDIDELQEDIRTIQKKQASLRTRRIAAPEKVESWKVWKKDQVEIDEDVIALDVRLKEARQQLELKIDALTAALVRLGIQINRDQVETLVYSVSGDDDIHRIAVFNNIKVITVELQRLTLESRENPEMARRYYGMHALLLRSLINFYQQCETRIDEEYLKRIGEIVSRQSELIEETRTKMAAEPEKFRAIYRTNLAAQRLTIRTAQVYGGCLRRNRERIAEAREKVNHEYMAAMNTWETVQAARDLITLMQNAETMLGHLSAMQTPELMVFENAQMKEEFRKLTETLNGE